MKLSDGSRRYYSGSKNAEFVDDFMLMVGEKYGPLSDPSTWIVNDIVLGLETKGDFWTRWNHIDHLCTTRRDLTEFCKYNKKVCQKKKE